MHHGAMNTLNTLNTAVLPSSSLAGADRGVHASHARLGLGLSLGLGLTGGLGARRGSRHHSHGGRGGGGGGGGGGDGGAAIAWLGCMAVTRWSAYNNGVLLSSEHTRATPPPSPSCVTITGAAIARLAALCARDVALRQRHVELLGARGTGGGGGGGDGAAHQHQQSRDAAETQRSAGLVRESLLSACALVGLCAMLALAPIWSVAVTERMKGRKKDTKKRDERREKREERREKREERRESTPRTPYRVVERQQPEDDDLEV